MFLTNVQMYLTKATYVVDRIMSDNGDLFLCVRDI